MTYEHERNITPVSRRKVSSYEIKFYDMDGNEMLIPDKPLSQAYTEILYAYTHGFNYDARGLG